MPRVKKEKKSEEKKRKEKKRKGKERKGKERKGKERLGLSASIKQEAKYYTRLPRHAKNDIS